MAGTGKIKEFLPQSGARETQPAQLVPSVLALHVTSNDSITNGAAVNITLQTNTSLIEVNAISNGMYMRYQATASNSNFDEYIQSGTTRHYVIPDTKTVISFIGDAGTAKLRLIEK